MFPAAFFLYLVLGLGLVFINALLFKLYLITIGVYYGIILFDSTIRNKSLTVGVLSMIASTLQLCGYGMGFLANGYVVFIKGNPNGISLGPSK